MAFLLCFRVEMHRLGMRFQERWKPLEIVEKRTSFLAFVDLIKLLFGSDYFMVLHDRASIRLLLRCLLPLDVLP